ncbi:Vesicle-associated membrane protein 7 [Fasciola gigantica]|uniref:Vesicle-associated membrane protein 7 n=1 Tax=Fasciola gigantica TaxID=46835 RepID=A0A504Y6N2_FASGI|nr:Vesicle-associated membrane protein 7 [Fasciola gigantica]
MSLFYCAVGTNSGISCEQSVANRNFPQLVQQYLSRNPGDQQIFYVEQGCGVHGLTVSGLSFVAVTSVETPRHQAVQFLTTLASDFVGKPGRVQATQTGGKGCMQHSYGPELQKLMSRWDQFKTHQQMAALQSTVDGVTNQLRQNMELVVQRGDRLDSLITKTSDLESSAQMFHATSKKVERKAMCAHLKMKFVIIGVGVAILVILILIILWQTGVFSKK